MLLIEKNKSLLPFNTFHIDENVDNFIEIRSEQELREIIDYKKNKTNEIKILGGGSNVLLTKKIEGLIILNKIKGKKVIQENAKEIIVQFDSGEIWHECVLWCVENQYAGIENLSLIPGTIGAAPIQNIGAYGVELKDVFYELEAIHLETGEKKIYSNSECDFGYRDSIFKTKEKGKYFILNVSLKLQKEPNFHCDYGDIKKVLAENFNHVINIKNISDAVIQIRKSKLPDPHEIGNAGSFFKNPIITKTQFEALQKEYSSIPFFYQTGGVKIPAAWLIEQCNWKGFRENDYGVHQRQALVLVNYKNAKGKDILHLSEKIITSVKQKFNIQLEPEVNIW